MALDPAKVEKELHKAHEYLDEVSTKLDASGQGQWLFGLERPTALDAQLVVMIRRLEEAGRQSVIPSELHKYAERAMQTPEWLEVMGGRSSTMYDGSTGKEG